MRDPYYEDGPTVRDTAMKRTLVAMVLLAVMSITAAARQTSKNVWAQQYKDRAAVDMAAQFENDRRPVYRHRADIIRLLELKPGMTESLANGIRLA